MAADEIPYMDFYVENATHVDVWRVLHGEPDITVGMKESVDR